MIQPAMGSGESTANFFIGDSGSQDNITTEMIFESEVLKGKEHQGSIPEVNTLQSGMTLSLPFG